MKRIFDALPFVALSLTNLCVHKTEIQLTTQGCARIYNIKVRECPEPVKAVKCQVCGGEGHRENRYMPLCQNAYTRYDVQKLQEGGVCISTFDSKVSRKMLSSLWST